MYIQETIVPKIGSRVIAFAKHEIWYGVVIEVGYPTNNALSYLVRNDAKETKWFPFHSVWLEEERTILISRGLIE